MDPRAANHIPPKSKNKQDLSMKSPTGPTERTPKPEYLIALVSNFLRGPLVRSHSIFDGTLYQFPLAIGHQQEYCINIYIYISDYFEHRLRCNTLYPGEWIEDPYNGILNNPPTSGWYNWALFRHIQYRVLQSNRVITAVNGDPYDSICMFI